MDSFMRSCIPFLYSSKPNSTECEITDSIHARIYTHKHIFQRQQNSQIFQFFWGSPALIYHRCSLDHFKQQTLTACTPKFLLLQAPHAPVLMRLAGTLRQSNTAKPASILSASLSATPKAQCCYAIAHLIQRKYQSRCETGSDKYLGRISSTGNSLKHILTFTKQTNADTLNSVGSGY